MMRIMSRYVSIHVFEIALLWQQFLQSDAKCHFQ